MKPTDFRPEHFTNGRNFNRADFDAYVQASLELNQMMYTRYLPSVFGGVVLGMLLSKGVGGFVGNILALVCIFGGLLLAPLLCSDTSKRVKELSKRLGISRSDISAARKHIKNGTTAWND